MTVIRHLRFDSVQDIGGRISFAKVPPLRLCVAKDLREQFASVDFLRETLQHRTFDSLLIVPRNAIPQDIELFFYLASEGVGQVEGIANKYYQQELSRYSPLLGFATYMELGAGTARTECYGECLSPINKFDNLLVSGNHLFSFFPIPDFVSPLMIVAVNHAGKPLDALQLALAIAEQLGNLKMMLKTQHTAVSYADLSSSTKLFYGKAYAYNFLLYLFEQYTQVSSRDGQLERIQLLMLGTFRILTSIFKSMPINEKELFCIESEGETNKFRFNAPVRIKFTGLIKLPLKSNEFKN